MIPVKCRFDVPEDKLVKITVKANNYRGHIISIDCLRNARKAGRKVYQHVRSSVSRESTRLTCTSTSDTSGARGGVESRLATVRVAPNENLRAEKDKWLEVRAHLTPLETPNLSLY